MRQQQREYDYLLQVCSEILIRASPPLDPSRLHELLLAISKSHYSAYAAEASRLNLVGWLLESSAAETFGGQLEEEEEEEEEDLGGSALASPSEHPQPSNTISDALSLLETKTRLDGRHDQEYNTSHVLRSIQEFTRSALSGLIAHGRVQSLMRDELTSTAVEYTQITDRSLFTYDSKVWLRVWGDRSFKELWRESERNLQGALKVHPEVIFLSFALCHLYAIAGRISQALETSRAALLTSPSDVDAITLHMLMVSQTKRGVASSDENEEVVVADVHQSSSLNAKVLEIDGGCVEAVLALLSSCSHCPSCMLRASQGMMRHLDVCNETDYPLGWRSDVWACLAGCLVSLAEIRAGRIREREEREEMEGIEISLAQQVPIQMSEEEALGLTECTDEEIIWDELFDELESRAWWHPFGYFSMPNERGTWDSGEGALSYMILIYKAVVCVFVVSPQDPFIEMARQEATRISESSVLPAHEELREALYLLESARKVTV